MTPPRPCRTLITALLLAPLALLHAADISPTKPNIIYLLADDLGYGDLGSYGQKLIRTPRLDAMAKQGLRFTDHYAGASSCQPSRCVLFTGKHTGHAFIRGNSKIPLRPEDFTLSQMLKQAGYATGGIGKWALGDGDTTGAPWRKGMDEFFGYLDQTHAHGYYPDFADMLPTFAELAGVKPPAGLDGISIAPTLLGQQAKQKTRDHHYWEAAPAQALRQGDWKVYRGAPDRPVELYNLATDISESRNVAAQHPEIAARLEKLLTQARVESAEFPLAAKNKRKP